ncbi:MAG TPA: hypothetical protein VEX67_10220 [Solirubrobacteraceae bacterium]|nr:hypothetical protein [Solirubrobacteraceae bacterium]
MVQPLIRGGVHACRCSVRPDRRRCHGSARRIPAEATAPGQNGEITFRRFVGPGDGVSTIFTIRPDGTGERQVSQPPEDSFDEFPDYASDGNLIAFTRCGPPVCKVMVARPDGSGIREVSPALQAAARRGSDRPGMQRQLLPRAVA